MCSFFTFGVSLSVNQDHATCTMSGDPQSSSRWWSDLTDECPITLEPLSTLPYPPFRLGGVGSSSATRTRSSGSDRANAAPTSMYFDGLALASYCVSRATFTNPLTREELTWDDCVRLDAYLEEYCYHNHHNDYPSTDAAGGTAAAVGRTAAGGRISVKEAYGLRSMVKVSGGGGGGGIGGNTAQEEANRRRAEALRSEAAAALRGLFVYGNDRTGSSSSSTGGMASPSASFSDALIAGPGARSGEMVPSAGFALHRLREGASLGGNRQGYDANGDIVLNEVEGLRIIDDDAAVAFGSDEAAWREVQEAFPTIDGSTDIADAVNALPRADVAEHPERSALLQRAKEVAAQTKRIETLKLRNEERGRQMLIENALKRRAEKLRLREERAAKEAADRDAKKADSDDMARARAEIEKWREEQFDMLNRMAEETRLREIQEEKKQVQLQGADRSSKVNSSDQSNAKNNDEEAARVAAESAAAERAAKKKAAKRKKERERQKAKRAAEKKEQERLVKIDQEKKRRAEAKLKCSHCSIGILDEGFEKMGHVFCSPKCARAGTST